MSNEKIKTPQEPTEAFPIFECDFDVSFSLAFLMQRIRETDFQAFTLRTFRVYYRGTGIGVQYYLLEWSYEYEGDIFIRQKSFEVFDQTELANLICYDFFHKALKELL